MSDPATYEEYLALFAKNNKVEGEGFETTVHVPCPFCSAPDFQVYAILSAEEAMVKNTMCKECHRSGKVVITKDDGNTTIELVQTGGEPPPPYLPVVRHLREAANDD